MESLKDLSGCLQVPDSPAAFPQNDTETSLDALISKLAHVSTEEERTRFLRSHPSILSVEGAKRLCRRSVAYGPLDLALSDALCSALDHLAASLTEAAISGYRDHARAALLHRQGFEFSKAASLWLRAIECFESAGLPNEAAISASCALPDLAYIGESELLWQCERQARSYFEATGDRLRLARLRSHVANYFFYRGEFERAVSLMKATYEDCIAENFGGPDHTTMLNNMAACYVFMGDLPLAIHLLEKAKALCEERGFQVELRVVCVNLAHARMFEGDLLSAIELIGQQYERCAPQSELYFTSMTTEAELLLNLGLGTQAHHRACSAYAGLLRLGLRHEAPKASVIVARALTLLGKPRAAIEVLDRAKELFASTGNAHGQRLCEIERARSFLAMGDLETTLKSITGLRSEAPTSAISELDLLLIDAKLRLECGDLGRARARAEKAHARSVLQGYSRQESEALRVLGDVYEALGLHDLAIEVLVRSQRSIDRLRRRLPSDDFRIAFLSDKSGVYQNLFVLALKSAKGGIERLLEIAEASKSRYLADNLLAGLSDRLVTGASADNSRLLDLHLGLRSVLERIDHLQAEPTASSVRVEPIKRSVADAERATRQLIQVGSGSVARAAEDDLPRIGEIAASLPRRSTLIEYYEARGGLFALVLSEKGLQLCELGSAAPIYRLCRLALFSLGRSSRSAARTSNRPLLAYLHDLYYLLWSKVEPHVDCERVVIVPHGPLHQFPFHALLGERFLVDDYAFSYAPSASVFCMTRKRSNPHSRGSVIVGLPDDGTPAIADEVYEVASLLPEARVFLARSATRERIAKELPSARFIHIATHGSFNAKEPQFSGVYLDDGPLTARDLGRMKLSADLVVLSGCETGRSAFRGCDELVGLTQALLQAGARSALVSLWGVADRETSAFMKGFHAELAVGVGRDESLRQALLRQKADYSEPALWAPFILVGDPGPE